MTQQPAPISVERRLSKSSLVSFICGILGCLPFVTGLLALVFGIIGFIRTGNPAKKGRWMAVVGLILGVVSLIAWSGAGLMGGGIWAIFKATEGPRIAAHDFIRDVSAGDDAAGKLDADGMSAEEYDATAKDIRGLGKFGDTTFFSTNITNDSATLAGAATFNDGTKETSAEVTADVVKVGGGWKVKHLHIVPK